jgi:hypothetical protein
MGELIPVGRKASGTKRNPVKIDSDVEMRDAGDSSDSSSESDSSSDSSSTEDGEITDVEMTDAPPEIPPVKPSHQLESKRKSHTEPEIKKYKKPRSPSLSKGNSDHRPPSKKDFTKSQTDHDSRNVSSPCVSFNVVEGPRISCDA